MAEERLERVDWGQPLRDPAAPSSSSPSATLSVVTYNVLADCYVRVPGQPWNAFAHCADAALDVAERRPRILSALLASDADVVCLQEVELERRGGGECEGSSQLPGWQLPAWTDALLQAGYVGIMQGLKQREWEQISKRNERMVGRPTPTGIASFYKAAQWEEFQAARYGSGSGTVLYLRSRACPKTRLAINNVHLFGDPAKFEAHLQQLEGGMRGLLSTPDGPLLPRLIAGDFNEECLPGSAVHDWACRNGLQDVPLGGATWAAPGQGLHLDHLLHSPTSLLPVVAYPPLGAEDVLEGLPNGRHPSDHALVGAVFRFVQAPAMEWR